VELARWRRRPAGGRLAAHYEFDGNLSDSSGHYQYGRLVHGDLTYSTAPSTRRDFDGETHAVFGMLRVR